MPNTPDNLSILKELVRLTHHLKEEIAFSADHLIVSHVEQRDGNNNNLLIFNPVHPKEFSDEIAQGVVFVIFFQNLMLDNPNFPLSSLIKDSPNIQFLLKNIDKILYQHINPSITSLRKQAKELIQSWVENINTSLMAEEKNDYLLNFYETFLQLYDKGLKQKRGVYYTPKAVADYMVSSLDGIMVEDFNLDLGLASPAIQLLDLSAGTQIFLQRVLKNIQKKLTHNPSAASSFSWKNFTCQTYELLPIPYLIGYFNLFLMLKELGVNYSLTTQMKLYCKDPLNQADDISIHQLPIILGNPPYSVSSSNNSPYIRKLMEKYKQSIKGERNIQPLSDDYIKFICLSHKMIEDYGRGCLAFITNNSFTTGLIHRGMREELMKTFDKIYILNLHGNLRYAETTPLGEKDDNIFSIMQGVSINFFIKNGSSNQSPSLFYHDLYGTKEAKNEYLLRNSLKTTPWQSIIPNKPFYFFSPDNHSNAAYQDFISITQIMPRYCSGVKTHRDALLVGFTKQDIIKRLVTFAQSNQESEILIQTLKLKNTADFTIKDAQQSLNKKLDEDINLIEKYLIDYSYRPMDHRYLCYLPLLIDRPRFSLMKHILPFENIGLIITRAIPNHHSYSHIAITTNISDIGYFGGQSYFFPLFLVPEKKDSAFFFSRIKDKQAQELPNYSFPNISKLLIHRLENKYQGKISPKQIMDYIIAVLHSSEYRKKYQRDLHIDFPRIPFTQDFKLFLWLSDLGQRIRKSFLQPYSINRLNPIYFSHSINGSSSPIKPGQIRYDAALNRVYINSNQYFSGVTEEVFHFTLGSYKVLHRWLLVRKNTTLSKENIQEWMDKANRIHNIIKIQGEICQPYEELENHIQDSYLITL